LFKVLAYSLDPFLPSIYGNEAAAMQFLLGSWYKCEKWRRVEEVKQI